MRCPKCGSTEVLPHYVGTFVPDEWICLHINRKREAPAKPKIGIKAWRKHTGKTK